MTNVFSNYNRRNKRYGVKTSSKDEILNTAIRNYEYYLDSTGNTGTYTSFLDEDITGKCAILDKSDNNVSYDQKAFTTLRDSKLEQGDIIRISSEQFHESLWLLTSQELLALPSHKKFLAIPCNENLKVKINGIVHELPVYGVNQTMYNIGIVKRETLDLYYGDTIFKISTCAKLAKGIIRRDLRFLINVNGNVIAYKVTYLDDSSEGVLVFQSSECQVRDEDDLENLIAYNDFSQGEVTDGEYDLTGEETVNGQGVYTITSDKNIDNLDFDFKVDDESLAEIEKVDNKTCILKAKKDKEYVTITAYLQGKIVNYKDLLIFTKKVKNNE